MSAEHGLATEEELARVRAKIGQKVTINEPPHLTEVTRDSIRHWAHATGDRNPLYLDESYARASRYGGLIAPPCQLYAFSRISIGYRGGLPGVPAPCPVHCGCGSVRVRAADRAAHRGQHPPARRRRGLGVLGRGLYPQ